MTGAELAALLETTGLPVAYRAFREKQAPPFLCYLFVNSQNFFADDSVYVGNSHFLVELYTSVKAPDTEAAVETVLSPFCWEKSEVFIDSEQIYKITYEIEV